MRADNDRLTFLFHRYIDDVASREELEELFGYIREAGQSPLLRQQITEVFGRVQQAADVKEVDWDAMFLRIINKPAVKEYQSGEVKKKRLWWKNVAAAILVLVLGSVGLYLYFHQDTSTPMAVGLTPPERDIMPGGNKATLTLSNGTQVVLDSTINGMLAGQRNTRVIKAGNGLLAYAKQDASTSNQSRVEYNTLTTPQGGQYQLTLSDGTKVWLNAASSIRYPVAFGGGKRQVEITGEAYFEVVHNEKAPFRVKVGDEIIEDLGTHFNVCAYADEPRIKTTLLEGSVKVDDIVLKPGEQAVLEKNGHLSVLKNVDTDDVIAWKNGFFAFNNANLKSVMKTLSRWYDIDVVYAPHVNNEQRFSGRIDRSLTLSQILNGLKQTRAHFRIEANRRVEILP